MKKNLLVLIFVFLTVFAFGQKLPFQGKLIESGIVVDDNLTFVFEISSVGWSETHNAVPVTDGLYFVVLGSINPLPDSLFYGVTEQNLNITVDGTVLSPVILFKPLSSPFEGGELVVKNDEGTVVGSMHAKTDSTSKNGELVLSGTSGSPNVSLGASGATGDQGAIQIHDSVGEVKAELWSADVNGRFRLYGENTGKLNMGFGKPWDPNGGETLRDLPSISLEVDGLYYSNTYVVQNDTTIRGRFYLASNVGEFNMIRTDGHFMYKDNVLMSQYRIQNWGGTGYSGFFDLRGPNSRNIEMGSKQWVNADLPWFKLMGSQNQDVIQMSASEDSTESAYINLLSQNEKEASFYTTGLRFNTTGDNGREMISLNNQDPSGNGYAGYLDLSGPSSGNIHLGTRHWENPDIPLLNMYGSEGQNIIELSAETDSLESGKIIVKSKNGSSTYLSTNGLNVFNSPINKSVDLGSTHFALRDDANGYHHLVDMHTSNGSGNGWSGYLGINGPSSTNVSMGSRDWDGTPDIPYMNFHGENDFHAMELSVYKDGNGFQFGALNLMSENGKSLHLSPEGFGAEGVGMETQTKDSLKFGYLYTRGPNTTNFETGGDWNNPDRAYLNMNGDTDENRLRFAIYEDGNQNEYGNIDIRSADNKQAVIEPNQIAFNHTDPNNWKELMSLRSEDNGQGGEMGVLHLNSMEGKSMYANSTNIALRDDANGYRHLIEMHTHNDSGNGWASAFGMRGPTTDNINMGSRYWEGTPDVPFVHLIGENDFLGMEFTMFKDGNGDQFGSLALMSENVSSANLNTNGLNVFNSVENKSVDIGANHIALRDDANGYHHLLDMGTHNASGNGWSSYFNIRGQNTDNINMGARDWDGTPDIPYLNFRGENDFHAIELTVFKDGNGDQLGAINLMSENGNSLNLTPDGFNSSKASIRNVNDGHGTSSELFLHGANSPNIQMGGQPWESSDLGFFQLFTDKPDGNGWYYAGANILAGTDGTNSWGIMGLYNNGEEKILLNGNTGDINIAGTLNQSSDRRLKKDIVKLSSSLDNLSRLQGVSYYWKSDMLNTKPQIGLIAQDVEKVYPELVVTKDDGFKALNYSQMVAVLIEATKELNAKVEKLETENIQLKAELSASASNTSEIEQLKEQMQALVKMVQVQHAEDINEEITSTLGLK